MARRLQDAEHRVAGGALARAGFADHRVDLSRADAQGQAVDGDERRRVRARVEDAQAVDVEHRVGRAHGRPRSFGLKRSRSQSPTTFTASTRITSVAAGSVAIHQMPENTNSLPMRISVPSEG